MIVALYFADDRLWTMLPEDCKTDDKTSGSDDVHGAVMCVTDLDANGLPDWLQNLMDMVKSDWVARTKFLETVRINIKTDYDPASATLLCTMTLGTDAASDSIARALIMSVPFHHKTLWKWYCRAFQKMMIAVHVHSITWTASGTTDDACAVDGAFVSLLQNPKFAEFSEMV